jgi:glycosyltransferase involved in cell wall biosynthesis
MIRVLQVVGGMNIGGAETRLLALARSMDASKFYFDFCEFKDAVSDYDAEVRRLGFGIVKCRLTKNVLGFSRQFREILRRGRYDIIHCHVHHLSGLLLRIAAKQAVPGRIMHLRTTGNIAKWNFYRFCYKKLMRLWIKKYSTTIAAVSASAMKAFMGPDWQQDRRTVVIYNGIDVKPFMNYPNRLSTLSEFDIPSDAKVVIHVGNFDPAKDHETLIYSATRVLDKKKNVHFLLVGNGKLMPKIRNIVIKEKLKDYIHFAGTRTDVPRLLMSSDCFIFPSRLEGLPGAVLEAIAAGLPVIGSDIGPIHEIAEQSNNVHLVPAGDIGGFARKVQEILENLDKHRKSPGQIPEQFCFQTYAHKMLELYERPKMGPLFGR